MFFGGASAVLASLFTASIAFSDNPKQLSNVALIPIGSDGLVQCSCGQSTRHLWSISGPHRFGDPNWMHYRCPVCLREGPKARNHAEGALLWNDMRLRELHPNYAVLEIIRSS